MWVIVEIYEHAVLTYPEGDMMLWHNKDTAVAYAEAVSARNPGVFQVQSLLAGGYANSPLVERRTHGYRLTKDKRDPLKITGSYPLPQVVYTKWVD